MESSLFKGITDCVNRVVRSRELDDLEVASADNTMLMNALRHHPLRAAENSPYCL